MPVLAYFFELMTKVTGYLVQSYYLPANGFSRSICQMKHHLVLSKFYHFIFINRFTLDEFMLIYLPIFYESDFQECLPLFLTILYS